MLCLSLTPILGFHIMVLRHFPASVLKMWCLEIGLSWWLRGEEHACQCRSLRFHPWFGNILWRRVWQPTPVFLLGKIPGTEEPGRLQSIRSQRVRHDWAHSHLQRLQNKILSWPKISFGFFCNILRKTSNKLFLANPIYHYKKCSCKHFENKFFMFPNETLKLGNNLHILQMTQLSSERQRFGPSS